ATLLLLIQMLGPALMLWGAATAFRLSRSTGWSWVNADGETSGNGSSPRLLALMVVAGSATLPLWGIVIHFLGSLMSSSPDARDSFVTASWYSLCCVAFLGACAHLFLLEARALQRLSRDGSKRVLMSGGVVLIGAAAIVAVVALARFWMTGS